MAKNLKPNLTKKNIQFVRIVGRKKVSKKLEGIHKKGRKQKSVRVPKTRSSIQPGRVLIVLCGPYKGKRVVCLGVLPSGLLVITGPFRVNGVPLRRVNSRYVIATCTEVDVSKVDISKFGDEYFGRTRAERCKERRAQVKKGESIFMRQGEETLQALPASKKNDQDDVDRPLLEALSKDPLKKQYLKTRFSLSSNMFPHKMNF